MTASCWSGIFRPISASFFRSIRCCSPDWRRSFAISVGALRSAWAKPASRIAWPWPDSARCWPGSPRLRYSARRSDWSRVIPDLFATIAPILKPVGRLIGWIASNVPRDAKIYAYQDPMLFLYTGHESCRLPIPPKFLYHADDSGSNSLMGFDGRISRADTGSTICCSRPTIIYRDLNAKGTQRIDAKPCRVSRPSRKLYGTSRRCNLQTERRSSARMQACRSRPIAYNHSKCRPRCFINPAAVTAVSLFAQKKPVTIDAVIQQTREHETPQVVWAPDGKHFAYFQGSDVMLYDVVAKSEKTLLSLAPLEKAAVPVPEAARDSTGRTAA